MKPCTHPADRLETLFPARDYVTGDPFEIRRCTACGLALTWPAPSPSEMGRYYPDAYYGNAGEKRFVGPVEGLQRALYGSRASQVEKAVGGRPGRVLDVGCGRGFLLDAFRRRGWTVEGTEMSEASSAHAREVLGIPVHVGSLESLALPAESFDAVTLWHVLEHVTDPGVAPRGDPSPPPSRRCPARQRAQLRQSRGARIRRRLVPPRRAQAPRPLHAGDARRRSSARPASSRSSRAGSLPSSTRSASSSRP